MDDGVRRAPGPVMVGVDGSQGSARALAWALREARDRRAPLRVVTAWAWGGTLTPGRPPIPWSRDVSAARQARQSQEALVRAVVARFPGALPQLTTELVQGDAASVLIDRCHGSDLLVLGSRGPRATGDARPGSVGSVTDTCLRHCTCPVVVVPAGSRPGTCETVPSQGQTPAGLVVLSAQHAVGLL